MSFNRSKTKNRRYIRYAIDLEATLVLEKAEPIQCVIQDFCSAGFFLGFRQPRYDLSFPSNKKIKIKFSVDLDHDSENFELEAQIMHATPSGLGVYVEKMPVAAFLALKQEAFNVSEKKESESNTISPSDLHQDKLKAQIKKWLDEEMSLLLSKFFERLGEDFKQAKESTASFMDRSALEDLVTHLKLSEETISSEFCNSIFLEVDGITNKNENDDVIKSAESSKLELIEKEDFEDWLNLSSVIRNLGKHYEDRINQIEGKLSHVFGNPAWQIKNPISPAILCDNFRELILQLKLENNINLNLYKIFGNALTENLAAIYDRFDKLLLSFGAPSLIAPKVVMQPEPPQGNYFFGGQQFPDFNFQNFKAQPDLSSSEEKLFSQLKIPEQKRPQPVGEMARKMLGFIKESNQISLHAPNDQAINKRTDSSNRPETFFSADEVISVISKLQKNAFGENHAHQNFSAFQKLLQDNLLGSNNREKVLTGQDEKNIEVYSKFFDVLFNDLVVSSEIKSYMERIHLTLLSLSLQGNDFLGSDSHPARNVLNQLASLETAVKDNRVIKKTNIKKTLDKLVTRINREATTNPNIFAEVEQDLHEVTEQVNKSIGLNIQRIVETYEGQQKLELARHSVQQQIDKRIAGKAIPAVIPALLSSGWQHLLVIIELNLTKTEEEKLQYYQVIDDLIIWLSDHESTLEEHRDAINRCLAFIDEQLSTVCTNAFEHERIMDDLRICLLSTGSARIRKAIGFVTIESASSNQIHSKENAEDSWILQVEQLQLGDWLTILRNSDGFDSMKLIFIGEQPKIYVFVDRDGTNKMELTKHELAELMQNGAANKIEDLDSPLMDRATNTMLQKMHEKLIYNATHDPLTDLLTRDEFIKQLKYEKNKLAGANHVLCHLKVQDFRMITNVCGVEGGNQLLKRLTSMLAEQFTKGEILARLGDKTFGVLFKNCSADEGFEIAKNLVEIIKASHFEWEDKSYAVAVSVGLVPFVESAGDAQKLLQQASFAGNAAEKSGINRIQLFNEEDENLKNQNKIQEWAGQIDKVLSENRLFLRCQKIAAVEPENIKHVHYEILMGVRDQSGTIIPPDHFIPAAERFKRMPEIDQWIISHVFRWIEENRVYFDQIDGFSINLSGQSINSEEFLEFLKQLLTNSSVPYEKLTFEITETVAADSLVYVKKFMQQIKQFGCKFSLDDFGSGYSSYAYLKSLNVDYLKIDGAFVKDIVNNKADVAIVKSMNEIAHSLGMKTVAEYVENNEIRNSLREIGVDYVQGYGVEKPKLITELYNEAWLAENATAQETKANEIEVSLENNVIIEISQSLNESAPEENEIKDEGEGLTQEDDFWGF
jgi:diguanylate cyclase (GGDEF)-like protein